MNGLSGANFPHVQKPVAVVHSLDLDQYQDRNLMEVVVMAQAKRKEIARSKTVQVKPSPLSH